MTEDKHPSITDFDALVTAHRKQGDQLGEITRMLHRHDAWINETTQSLGQITAGVAENTELTRDIKDAITAGRVAGQMAKWAAAALVTGSTAWLAFKGMFKP